MNKFYMMRLYCHTLGQEEAEHWVNVETLGIHPDLAQWLAELGIIKYSGGQVPAEHAARLWKIMRLRRDLGVNLPGAAIIIELLERIEELQEELERLKRLGYE